MKTSAFAAAFGLTLVAVPTFAQDSGSAPPGCYIQVARLMAEPPAGIGDLGAALQELETALRPQVDHVNQLRTRLARLEQRQAVVNTGQGLTGAGLEPVGLSQPLQPADESTLAEMQELQAELDERRSKLKLDYAERRAAIVGPVQVRIGQQARAYAAEQGCSAIRMARAPDLPALASAGARDLTASFVSWYASNSGASGLAR